MRHGESHRIHRVGWLRAAVLGANDGIISVASLLMGMAAANVDRDAILLAGVAGLVAGAVSMAAGEYVSVQSQADTEAADLEKEREELEARPESELRELRDIYIDRGLDSALAHQVAVQLMQHDSLGAHARDELGIFDFTSARPFQAAAASAASFTVGALIPLLVILLAPHAALIPIMAVVCLISLAILGGMAAKAGGASLLRGALRVSLWGALAMLVTGIAGHFFDAVG